MSANYSAKMDEIFERLKETIEGVIIRPGIQGLVEIEVQDREEICAVLATIADIMSDYALPDLRITTNSENYSIYIEEL